MKCFAPPALPPPSYLLFLPWDHEHYFRMHMKWIPLGYCKQRDRGITGWRDKRTTYSKPPSPKLAPVVVPPHQLCWRGQHRGLCFGGNRSLWWDPFGALWFKIQDAELIFTALSRGATSLLISRWRLSNQGSPQPAPAALVGLTGLWSTWEATE